MQKGYIFGEAESYNYSGSAFIRSELVIIGIASDGSSILASRLGHFPRS